MNALVRALGSKPLSSPFLPSDDLFSEVPSLKLWSWILKLKDFSQTLHKTNTDCWKQCLPFILRGQEHWGSKIGGNANAAFPCLVLEYSSQMRAVAKSFYLRARRPQLASQFYVWEWCGYWIVFLLVCRCHYLLNGHRYHCD